MKKFLFVLISVLLLISCNKEEFNGHKEEIVKELKGTWDINSSKGNEGTITFLQDSQFTMKTDRGNVFIGDYEESPEGNSLAITWAEDEDENELLTDEDYENGGLICKYSWNDNGDVTISNLPYFRNETIKLNNKH